jgi:hypothetical protein
MKEIRRSSTLPESTLRSTCEALHSDGKPEVDMAAKRQSRRTSSSARRTSTRRKGTAGTLPEVIYAQASPRSIGGSSLFHAPNVSTENVVGYLSDEAVVRAAVVALQERGFRVLQVMPTTINIAGPPQAYESVFETRLVTEEREVIKEFARKDTATFIDCPDTDLRGLIDTSKNTLGEVIEGVAIEEPVYFHQHALAPPQNYWHLRVPGDVSLGVNADRAHRGATTGAGVRVAMVDTGWFRHPYFVERGYRANQVVLGPGATNRDSDEVGHGTGESANIFAVAPDVDFTMVKMSFTNSTGAFNAAAALRPHVITNSWGGHVPSGPLSAAQLALAAAVSTAVASGIVVVFSAGNGHFGFPGQHPDVVSAGGVFMQQDGSLMASDYSSGFASAVYPGRTVPDVCGLVGQRPRAIYIMLPVEPGDELDTANAGGAFPNGDLTGANDGWAAFSGTSAAAPQIAGVCALIKQAAPTMSPHRVRDTLIRTARDVTAGTNSQGERAVAGHDLATGSGLVDAAKAVIRAKFLRRMVPRPLPRPKVELPPIGRPGLPPFPWPPGPAPDPPPGPGPLEVPVGDVGGYTPRLSASELALAEQELADGNLEMFEE